MFLFIVIVTIRRRITIDEQTRLLFPVAVPQSPLRVISTAVAQPSRSTQPLGHLARATLIRTLSSTLDNIVLFLVVFLAMIRPGQPLWHTRSTSLRPRRELPLPLPYRGDRPPHRLKPGDVRPVLWAQMVAAVRAVTGDKLPGGVARQLGQREARGEAAYREEKMYKAVK